MLSIPARLSVETPSVKLGYGRIDARRLQPRDVSHRLVYCSICIFRRALLVLHIALSICMGFAIPSVARHPRIGGAPGRVKGTIRETA